MCEITEEQSQKCYTVQEVATMGEPTLQIYTSYWGNVKKLNAADVVPVGISRYPPRFVTGVKTYLPLAPQPDMLAGLKAGTMSLLQFNNRFDAMLDKLDAQQVLDELLEMGGGKPVAILCFEKPGEVCKAKPGETCHRHKVAGWLREKLGITIKEFPFK